MNIVITGGSKGIGLAIAKAFAGKDNHILICARQEASLKNTVAQLKQEANTENIHGFVADVAIKEEVVAFANFCLGFGVPDVLVNNAGFFVPGNVLDEEEGALEKMLNSNLMSAYHLCRLLVPAMKQAKSGHIFNISSIAALKAYEGGGGYSISKFALNGFSSNLRHELKSYGVKVTTVMPGAVFTDSWKGFDNSEGRIMEAKDIADMVFACSKLSPQAVVEEIIIRPQLGDL